MDLIVQTVIGGEPACLEGDAYGMGIFLMPLFIECMCLNECKA